CWPQCCDYRASARRRRCTGCDHWLMQHQSRKQMAEQLRVAVVGAGTMGNGIAHVFAQHGHECVLIDVSRERLDAAQETIAANLVRQVKKGALGEADRKATLERLRTVTDLGAARDAALVIEAVPEKLEL